MKLKLILAVCLWATLFALLAFTPLKPDTKVMTMVFNEKVIKVAVPIKMDFEVIEAPPAIKGNTAQGGTKTVTLEGGASVNVPLFINTGDIIRINTETGEYVERIEKA